MGKVHDVYRSDEIEMVMGTKTSLIDASKPILVFVVVVS